MEPVKAPTIANIRWLQALMHLMFDGADTVRWKVKTAGWEKDGCLGVVVACQGWSKQLRIPISQIDAEDVRRIVIGIGAQSEGAILMQEHSIQMIESDRMMH